jgi:hypothetical protein
MSTKAKTLALAVALISSTALISPAWSQGYTKFVDPRESAFSIEVPQGWSVQGGLLRHSALAYNFVLQLQSPDGQHIEIGDANILPFTAPGPGLPPPGSKYPIGQGVVMMVAPYKSGVQFAQQWGGSVLSQACGGQVKLQSASPVESPSRAGTDSSGQAVFACRERIAYVFATTRKKPGPQVQWEAADTIIGLAPPKKIRNTVAVIYHMIGSARINPQWMVEQLQRSGTSIEAARQMTKSIMRTQEQTSINTPGSANHAIDQVVRGYTTTPGGKEVEVQGRGNYYWNCGGRQVNTQSYMPPRANCEPIR